MLTEQEPLETLIKRNSKENLNIEYYASKGNKKGKGNMKWILIASNGKNAIIMISILPKNCFNLQF